MNYLFIRISAYELGIKREKLKYVEIRLDQFLIFFNLKKIIEFIFIHQKFKCNSYKVKMIISSKTKVQIAILKVI